MKYAPHRFMQPRAALVGVALSLLAAGPLAALEAGDEAPTFANPDLKGNYLTLKKAVGKRWVVVNFFATWCEPCKQELPALEALQREAGPDALQVIVFATDKQKDDVKQYFDARPTNLTILLDPYQVTYLRYNKADDGLPTIFLIAPDGKIAMRHVGYSPDFIKELRAKVLAGR